MKVYIWIQGKGGIILPYRGIIIHILSVSVMRYCLSCGEISWSVGYLRLFRNDDRRMSLEIIIVEI